MHILGCNGFHLVEQYGRTADICDISDNSDISEKVTIVTEVTVVTVVTVDRNMSAILCTSLYLY